MKPPFSALRHQSSMDHCNLMDREGVSGGAAAGGEEQGEVEIEIEVITLKG